MLFKRKHRHFVLAILVIIIIGFFYLNYCSLKTKKELYKQIISMPNYTLYSIFQSNKINQESLGYNKPTLILYFNSQCDLCNFEITDLDKTKDKFSGVNVVLFSYENIDSVRKFIFNYSFIENENFFIGRNDYDTLINLFGCLTPPMSFLYDTNKKLIRKNYGSKSMCNILSDFGVKLNIK